MQTIAHILRAWLVVFAILLPNSLLAESLRDDVDALYQSKLGELFLYFHQNPELSTMEQQTAVRLADELEQLGYRVERNVGGTGIVALLENGEGPLVMFRADMDGLPIEEKSGLAYASRARQIDPNGNEVFVMHACGHDVHITSLIGTAEMMAFEAVDRRSIDRFGKLYACCRAILHHRQAVSTPARPAACVVQRLGGIWTGSW